MAKKYLRSKKWFCRRCEAHHYTDEVNRLIHEKLGEMLTAMAEENREAVERFGPEYGFKPPDGLERMWEKTAKDGGSDGQA